VTVNGALVDGNTVVGADWLLRTVIVDVEACPWNVDGNEIDAGVSVNGTTLVPLNGTLSGPPTPCAQSRAWRSRGRGAMRSGRNVTTMPHDAPGASGAAQPPAA
jgi:hypothetical protein